MSRGGARRLALSLVVSSVGYLGACAGEGPIAPCPPLGDGQCTKSRGGSCVDATCRAIYVCEPDRTWRLDEVCAAGDAGTDAADARADEAGDGDDAGGLGCDAAIEASTATGCAPELELPDCPVEAAHGCAAAACATGCEAFFACTSAGWSEQPVASCVDGGLVTR